MPRQILAAVYYEFVRFIATPTPFREIKDQKEFQQIYNVSHSTLANYKRLPNFWGDVKREFDQWAKENTPNVMSAMMVKAIMQGDSRCAEIWLKYVERFGMKDESENTGGQQQPETQITAEQQDLIMSAFGNFGVLTEPQNKPNEQTNV